MTYQNFVSTCFQLPHLEEDYHAVAFEPIINNTGILHHMLLFSCTDDDVETMETVSDEKWTIHPRQSVVYIRELSPGSMNSRLQPFL
jgi:hypothetical protein